jgi:hypothetical protein
LPSFTTCMSDPVPSLAPVRTPGSEDPLGQVLAELDAVLAGLESTAARFGRRAALPFLGLARYELSEALANTRLGVSPPETFENGETRVEELVMEGLALEPCLADSLRLLRARGLMREAQTWAARAPSEPRRHE